MAIRAVPSTSSAGPTCALVRVIPESGFAFGGTCGAVVVRRAGPPDRGEPA
jgi:hypothetical protein